MRPPRKDLIPRLLDNPRTVVQIARDCGATPAEIADDVRHLLRSLRHTRYRAEIEPARCRKCGFSFSADKLLKPSKCPACHGTWLAEPRICLREPEPPPPPPSPPPPAADPSPSWLEPLDHTADAGFIVRADSLAQLFERAAWGMFSLICDLSAVHPTEHLSLDLEADDTASLLVRWLSELNFRHVTGHHLYSSFLVTGIGGGRLQARASGEPADPARHTIHTEIKAVTYHGLDVSQDAAGWTAQVIFDL